jgi:beta-N-acetylhexosaminidase
MDLMEICHSPELILRGYESLVSEAERSASFRALLLTRARSAAAKRKRYFGRKAAGALSARQLEALRKRILQFTESVSQMQPGEQS